MGRDNLFLGILSDNLWIFILDTIFQIRSYRRKIMEYNCGFIDGDKWFRYRAAAIIVEDRCV